MISDSTLFVDSNVNISSSTSIRSKIHSFSRNVCLHSVATPILVNDLRNSSRQHLYIVQQMLSMYSDIECTLVHGAVVC